ncbi:MAG TPA: hypothetical protein PLT68_00965 [Actinomycetota bacterium]|nr:hypothetical protein [Actinomycetota bacterium]
MGITSSALSKARAAVSKTQADVDELKADQAGAQTKLKLLQTGDKAVDTLTQPFADQAGALRQRSEAAVSAAQADLDEISARLEVARTKHNLAVKALETLESVTDD